MRWYSSGVSPCDAMTSGVIVVMTRLSRASGTREILRVVEQLSDRRYDRRCERSGGHMVNDRQLMIDTFAMSSAIQHRSTSVDLDSQVRSIVSKRSTGLTMRRRIRSTLP